MIEVIAFKVPPRPPAAERLGAAIVGLERACRLPNVLIGRAKSAFERACVAYAEGHADIAIHELATMDMWLELARREADDPVNAAKSALSEVDRAYALLTQDWRREALKAARKRAPKPLPGFEDDPE